MKRSLRYAMTFALFIAMTSPIAFGAVVESNSAKRLERVRSEERTDRVVDSAALSAKLAAIRTIERLLQRPGIEDRKALLMMRLAETLQQTAEMDYRIRFSEFKRMHPLADPVIPPSKFMERSLNTLLALEQMQGAKMDRGRIRYLKAIAYRELGKKDDAIREFQQFVRDYPKRDEILDARFAVIRLLREKKDFASALSQLRAFQVQERSAYESYRLELLFLTSMDLDDLNGAVRIVESELGRIQRLGAAARVTELEKSYDHAIRVFMRGFEIKSADLTLNRLYALLSRTGKRVQLGKAYLEVAKTLRVKEMRPQMNEWQLLLKPNESNRPEWKEILWISAEYELLNGKMAEFRRLMAQIQEVLKTDASRDAKEGSQFREKIEQALLEKASSTQAKIKEVKEEESNFVLSKDLNSIYLSFIDFAGDRNPRTAEVRFAVAENSFKVKEYSAATQNYLWIIHHLSRTAPRKGSVLASVSVPSLVLKAIGARYEEFRSSGRFPKDLKAKPLESGVSPDVEPQLAAWLSWIERYRYYEAKGTVAEKSDTIDGFEFEALRLLYHEGRIKAAIQKMMDFAFAYPKSSLALPSALLAVDTQVLSAKWEDARSSALKALTLVSEKDEQTREKLREIASESTYQLARAAYQDNDPAVVITETERYLKEFAKRSREKDCLALAVQAALARKDRAAARDFTDQLIARHSRSPEGIDAYRLRSEFNEFDLEFAAASQDLRRYLISEVAAKSGDVKESVEHRKHALFLAWISGDAQELRKALEFPSMCDKAVREECDKYQGLLKIASDSKLPRKEYDAVKEKALYGNPVNRAVWTLVLLGSDAKFSTEQRFRYLEELSVTWDKVDPLIQLALFPKYLQVSHQSLEQRRRDIASASGIEKGPSWIRQRTLLLEDYEKKAKIALSMPWTRIQTNALASISLSYLDFWNDLGKFESSLKGLPEQEVAQIKESLAQLKDSLREKTIDFARKALNIAMQWGVEESETLRIVRVLAQFPEIQQRDQIMMAPADIPRTEALTADFMNQSERDGGWVPTEFKPGDSLEVRAKSSWAHAIASSNWPRAGYVIKVVKEKKLWSEQTLARAQLVLFDALGARSEALNGFEYGLDQMEAAKAQQPLDYALSLAVHSLSKEKAAKVLKLVEHYWRKGGRFQFAASQARLYLYAAHWTHYDLPSNLLSDLTAVAERDPGRKPTGRSAQ